MAQQDDSESSRKRTFVVVEPEIETPGKYTGQSPSQAMRKAARDIIDTNGITDETEAKSTNGTEIRLKEKGEGKTHVYTAWTWERPRKEGEPTHLNEVVVEVGYHSRGSYT